MTDGFGRTIDYLRLSVTDLCNYRCCYCMPEDGVCKKAHGEICALEELAGMAEAAVSLGVKKIRITGGEPLVRKGILSLVERLAALPGLEELTMTTNGSFLPELAAPLRQAGLDRLNVSLDTLRPERFSALTRGGDLGRVLEGLRAAGEAGFDKLKLNVVLLKGTNDDELAELAGLAKDRPLSVRFIELMPIGPAAALFSAAFLPAEAVLAAVPELRPLKTDGVARLYTAPGWQGSVGLISPMSCDFCESCSRIRVTADGRLKLCLHAAAEIPLRGLHGEALRQAMAQGILGKPERHHLSDAPSRSERQMNEIGG